MMTDDELKELADDIGEHGLHQPIVLTYDESVLVDGRNRLRACEIAGVDFTAEVLPEDYTDQQIIDYIVSANIRRRHLTPGQKAMLATELEPMYAEAARERVGGRPRLGEEKPTANSRGVSRAEQRARESAEQAAKAVGSSGRSVADAKALKKDAPDLAEKVSTGDMTLNAATKERKARKASTAKKRPPRPNANREEWVRLEKQGKTLAEIAQATGGSENTIRRELERNRLQEEAEAAAALVDWDTIPGTQRQKFERAVAAEQRRLEKSLRAQMLAALDQYRAELDEGLSKYKGQLDAQNERLRITRDEEVQRAQQTIDVYRARGLITPADYDLIRACLHPDSRLSVSDDRLAAAFRVFNDPRIKTLLVKEI
jgi:ParB-like chromosome segregation protein Spo0J